ncbi:unnamed protein product [Owenia fusiformis]|uniref:Uncharacterized protein n=1 Tax=Owenia fusiformis TaxID=6347 RepID=A0A8J1TXY1_OWEFU|nr:unnamed protein product [Owenia fusiformis]
MVYQEKAAELTKVIEGYLNDDADWKEVKNSKGVKVWAKKSEMFGGRLYKAEGVIDSPKEKVFEMVEPKTDGKRPGWDKAIKGLETLETVDDKTSVVRTVTHSAAKGLISSRDFVDVTVTVEADDYVATIAQSVTHSNCPEESGVVRGTNHPCGLICRPEGDKTKLIHFCQADIGGMLPTSLVESALPSNIVSFYESLREALK